jgi:hypothetical protein
MASTRMGLQSHQSPVRDLRGILVAFATALAMWVFLIIAVLGFVLKIMR